MYAGRHRHDRLPGEAGSAHAGLCHDGAAEGDELYCRAVFTIGIVPVDLKGNRAGSGQVGTHPYAVALQVERVILVFRRERAARPQGIQQVGFGQARHPHASTIIRVSAPVDGVRVGVVGGAQLPAIVQRTDVFIFGEDIGSTAAVAHFFQAHGGRDLRVILPIVKIDPARVVELGQRTGAIQRLRPGDGQPVIETVHRHADLEVGRVIAVRRAGVGAAGMAHRVIHVDVAFRALSIFGAAQCNECTRNRRGFNVRQRGGPFAVINGIRVIGDGHEVEAGGPAGRQRLDRRQRAIGIRSMIVQVAVIDLQRRFGLRRKRPAQLARDRIPGPVGHAATDGDRVASGGRQHRRRQGNLIGDGVISQAAPGD